MAKVTYHAPAGEPKTQTQFDIEWTDGKPVEVTNTAVLAKVRVSDHYDVDGETKAGPKKATDK